MQKEKKIQSTPSKKKYTFLKSIPVFLLGVSLFAACSKSDVNPNTGNDNLNTLGKKAKFPYTDTGCGPYQANLVSKVNNGDGTWTWTWTIYNPNPGNGSQGTVQDLSHFGIQLDGCITIDNVLKASYSKNGQTWKNVPVSYGVDPSLKTCNPDYAQLQMLKFDVGTSGTSPIYFQVVVNIDLIVNDQGKAYYKSGANTGCGTFCFPGFKCQES